MNPQINFWILPLLLGSLLGFDLASTQEHESISVANGEQLVTYKQSDEPRIYRKETRHYHKNPSKSWSLKDLFREYSSSIYGPPYLPPGSGGGGSGTGGGGSGTGGGGGSGTGGGGGIYGTGSGTSSSEMFIYADSEESSAEYGFGATKRNCILCPFPFVEVWNSCYFAPNCTSNPTPLTWAAARTYCQGQLGVASDLAVFNDTNQYVNALNYIRFRDPTSACSYWIGGLNVNSNSTFQWITGGNIPLGKPLWGNSSTAGILDPTNIATNIYAYLSKADFYRLHNIAATATLIPLCQYVPTSCIKGKGANSGTGSSGSGSGSGSSGGSSSVNVVNTVVNQEGSSYHSLQNITFTNTPLINVTSDFNSTAPSPLNITVFPPNITYTYYDADQNPQQCPYGYANCVPSPYVYSYNSYNSTPYSYNGSNFNWETIRRGSKVPPAIGSYVKSNYPIAGYNVPPMGSHITAQSVQPQPQPEISYLPIYSRILNTMKTLMSKIESNSHHPEEGASNSAVETLTENSSSSQ